MADEAKADVQIPELNLSVRVRNILLNSNINTLSELCMMTDAQFLRTPGFGRQALNEIKDMIHRRDYSTEPNEKYTLLDEEYYLRLLIKYDQMSESDRDSIIDVAEANEVAQNNSKCLYRALKEINNVKGLPEPVYQIIRDAYRELSNHPQLSIEALRSASP